MKMKNKLLILIMARKGSRDSISRQNFYSEAKNAYCIVTTTDARPFGCFILTKGVILPDGKVWS